MILAKIYSGYSLYNSTILISASSSCPADNKAEIKLFNTGSTAGYLCSKAVKIFIASSGFV